MGLHQRDLARRFITFIDAAYESKVKILTTSEVPILQIFAGEKQEKGPTKDQMRSLMDDLVSVEEEGRFHVFIRKKILTAIFHFNKHLVYSRTVVALQRLTLFPSLLALSHQGLTMNDLGGSPIFTGEEELFAFARVISRLTEMGTAHYASAAKGNEAPPEF